MSSDDQSAVAQQKSSASTHIATQQTSSLKSVKIFRMIGAFLERATDATSTLKSKVNSCFQFEIAPKQGQPTALKWTIDLREDGGGNC